MEWELVSRLEELLECSSAGREQGPLFGARRDGQGFISMARLCGDEEESVGRYVYLKLNSIVRGVSRKRFSNK